MSEREQALAIVRAVAADPDLGGEEVSPGVLAIRLPGVHRHGTVAFLAVGDHALTVEVFVCRAPEDNVAEVHRLLLQRNGRLFGAAYTIDDAGDIYLVGRRSLTGLTEADLDQLLGAVAQAADSGFDRLIALGFASAIRREWAWRRSRGESTANLAAFTHLAD